jgi:hypothetical protein
MKKINEFKKFIYLSLMVLDPNFGKKALAKQTVRLKTIPYIL